MKEVQQLATKNCRRLGDTFLYSYIKNGCFSQLICIFLPIMSSEAVWMFFNDKVLKLDVNQAILYDMFKSAHMT